jgi:hypothetical protein
MVQAGRVKKGDTISKLKKKCQGMDQMIVYRLSNFKTLSSNPSTAKKKRKKKRNPEVILDFSLLPMSC